MNLTGSQKHYRVNDLEKGRGGTAASSVGKFQSSFGESETTGATNRLIAELLEKLNSERIRYCHWKSNWRIEDWLQAKGDLDLLICSRDVCGFTRILSELGFKKVMTPPEKELPGVVNYYGYDAESQNTVHIHAHYQLVFGHDLTKNYRLPIESPLLDAAVRKGPIKITSPDIELVLFVIRMVLKFSLGEAVARRAVGKSERLSREIAEELYHLSAQAGHVRADAELLRHFPMIDAQMFESCLASLQPKAGLFRRYLIRRELEKRLHAHARRERTPDQLTKLNRRIGGIVKDYVLGTDQRKRFENGGTLIAFVGGDGAGKTTCVKEISNWLGAKFCTRTIHIGKPPRSGLTLAVTAAGKLETLLSRRKPAATASDSEKTRLQELRHLCTARDRYRLYRNACRYAARGGIVICDRYPMQQIELMDGPKISPATDGASKGAIRLREIEEWYYKQILAPDMLIVLRVDPETAVQRKPDEPAEHVRSRSAELWQVDWNDTGAQVVDTKRPMPEVLADLRSLVWSAL